jgi:glutamate 5-kinase
MRIAIKLGTSTLTHETGRLNIRRVESIGKILSDLKNEGHEIIIISSGAIAMGAGKLGMKEKPKDMPGKQAAAAVGQCELMYTYDKLFSEYGHTVAQILVTADDFGHADRFANFRNTISRLLELSAIPVINENDTVSTDEIVIGDNDTLAARVSTAVEADILVLLSDIDGLYTSDPRKDSGAVLIPCVTEITDDIRKLAGGKGSEFGTGGMETKIRAAEICMEAGSEMIIANGSRPELLYDIVQGLPAGTRFRKETES